MVTDTIKRILKTAKSKKDFMTTMSAHEEIYHRIQSCGVIQKADWPTIAKNAQAARQCILRQRGEKT